MAKAKGILTRQQRVIRLARKYARGVTTTACGGQRHRPIAAPAITLSPVVMPMIEDRTRVPSGKGV